MSSCPNKKSTAWQRLLKSLSKFPDRAEEKAMSVFIKWGNSIPDSITASNVVNGVGFKKGPMSPMQFGKMCKRIGSYNRNNGTAHYVTPEYNSDKDTFKAVLNINFYPSMYSTPRAYHEEFFPTEEVDIDGTPITVNNVASQYTGRTVNVDGVTVVNGNEYWFNNELYSSMEDAIKAKEAIEFQMKSSGYGKANTALDKYLEEFLGQYGITVKQIDDFKQRFGIDGVAAADMVNNLILVAQGRADALTIPEEAAHFIIDMLGESHPLYKAMEKVIKDTDEYKEVVRDYSEVYGGNEKKMMKEAMGKVLAKRLYNQYQGKNSTLFDRVIQWIKNLFKSAKNRQLEDKLNDAFSEVADGVLKGYIDLNSNNIIRDGVYYQVDESRIVGVIRKNIRELENRANFIERNTQSNEALSYSNEYRSYAEIIKQQLESGEVKLAIVSLIEVLEKSELEEIQEELRRASEAWYNESPLEDSEISNRRIKSIYETMQVYDSMLSTIDKALEEDRELKKFKETQISSYSDETLSERIARLKANFSSIKADAEKNMRTNVRKLLEEISVTYTGPDGKKIKFNPDELLESKVGNIGWVGANVMPMHSVSDEVLKMVYKIVVDIHMESQRGALDDGNRLKALQLEMEKSGFRDMGIFFEKDKNGDKTGFLLTNDNWGEYNQEYENMHKRILDKINAGRDNKYEEFYDIRKSDLSKEEVKIYESEINEFSRKFRKKVDGIWVANPNHNPKYDELMKMHPSVKAYYDEMKRIHIKTREMLPKGYMKKETMFLMPQIRMDDMQVLASGNDPLMKKLKLFSKKQIDKFRILEDDLGYGDTSGYGGSTVTHKQKLLPIYFVRKLNNMRELSDNTTGMYANFSEMARGYGGLFDRLPDLFVIQESLGNRSVFRDDKEFKSKVGISGLESNEYKAFQSFMSIFVFGEEKQDVKIKVGDDKVLRPSKFIYKVIDYIRKKNLFMNLPTILSGYVKSNIDLFLDSVTGLYITKESQWWATKEVARNFTDKNFLKDIVSRKKESKIYSLMERSGANGDMKKIFNRLDLQNPLQRFTMEDFWYGAYEIFGFQNKAVYTLAVYDNYRLVGDKIISKEQFKELRSNKSSEEINEEWESLREKSMYNMFEMKNGELVVMDEFKKHITPQLENTINGIITSRTKAIEGNLAKFDKSAWSSTIVGNLLLMHRGWMVQGAVDRLKKGGVNYNTGIYEEGFYRTMLKMIWGLTKHEQRKLMFTAPYWRDMPAYQKRNVYKSLTDISFAVALYALYLLMNSIADDDDNDDDWGVQFLAYLSTRMFLEQGAFYNPKELPSILNSPSAAFSTIDILYDVLDVFDTEKVKYGIYKDYYGWQKGLMKLSPLHNIKKLEDPSVQNKYVRNMIVGN